jgi:hypothetical protein
MQYSPKWFVENLMIVPSLFFSLAAVENADRLGHMHVELGG